MKTPLPNLPALIEWTSDAVTVLANGILSGLGGGTVAGAGTGAVSVQIEGGMTHNGMTVALATIALSALGNGLKRVVVWHDSHPIPNPYKSDSTPPKL